MKLAHTRILSAAGCAVAAIAVGQVKQQSKPTLGSVGNRNALLVRPLNAPDITLLAGSIPGASNQVRLRWAVTAGWVPRGQRWSIYRIVNGVRGGPLNPTPIVFADPGMGNSAGFLRFSQLSARKASNAVTPFSLPGLVEASFKAAPGMTDRQIYTLAPSGIPLTSAAPAFAAFKQSILSQNAAKVPMLPPTAFAKIAKRHPAVSPLLDMTRVTQSGALGTMRTMALTLSPADAIRSARSALMVGILSRPGVSTALGTEFTDTAPTIGTPTTYVLSFIGADGKPMDMADTTLTAGQDPQPSPPSGLDSIQIGVNTVAVYWKPATDDESKRYFLPTYNVYRIDAAHPAGVLLTPNPISKAVLHATTVKANVEPLYSFVDSAAPLPSCSYKVTTVDALGRESATGAQTSTTVEDWATPPPVSVVPNPKGPPPIGTPTIRFGLDGDPKARFHVYRQTADGALSAPTLVKDLGPSDAVRVIVTFQDTTAPPDHNYRYSVCAYYPSNNRDSGPSTSGVYSVPTPTGPAAPTGLAGQVAIIPRSLYGDHLLGAIRSRSAAFTSAVMLAAEGTVKPKPGPATNKVNTNIFRNAVMNRSTYVAPTYGANVTLTWQESTQTGLPIRYQIYRVDVTPPPTKRGAFLPGIKDIHTNPLIKRAASPPEATEQTPVAPARRLSFSTAARNAVSRLIFGSEDAVLVGQTTGALTLTSGVVPSSTGRDFQYFVVPTNRWGQQGPASAIAAVHIGPTIAPTAPDIVYVAATPANRAQVELKVLPYAPEKEVTVYHVYRLDLGARPAPAMTTPGASGGTSFGLANKLRLATGAPLRVLTGIGNKATQPAKPAGPTITTDKGTLHTMAVKLRAGDAVSISALLNRVEDPSTYTEVPAAQLAVTSAGGFVHILDSGTAPLHEYAYRVIAENSTKLKSGYSAYLDATTAISTAKAPVLGQPVATPTGISIPITADAGLVVLERSLGNTGIWIHIEAVASGGNMLDPGPVAGQVYHYRATLVDAFGNKSAPSPTVDITYTP